MGGPLSADPVLSFESQAAWEAWLAEQHATSNGVWMKVAKKASGIPSVTIAEALDVALCYGWIDGQRKRFDEQWFLQRFTPRRARSNWSKINRAKAEHLIREGRMQPAGLAEIERARADGRWDAAYDAPRTATVVRVEPITEAWAEALAQGDDVFSERFGVAVAANWAPFPEIIPFMREAARDPRSARWGPHLVFDDDGALVGNAGWKGEPVDGVAELGYAVAPGRRGRGIATAVVRELLARARGAGLRTAIAHTRPEPSPSTSVLTRAGFRKMADVVDPDDGPVWRWEVSLSDS